MNGTMKIVTAGFALFIGMSSGYASPAVEKMEMDSVSLSYVSTGKVDAEGGTLVFVHGAIGDHRVWQGVISALSANNNWRLVAYTQRHFGAHELPLSKPSDFGRETHIADLIGFVESLNQGPVTLVSWSYGGEISLHAQLRRPELFRAAVHFEPVMFPLLLGLPGGKRAMSQKFKQVILPAASIAKQGDLEKAAFRFIEGVFKLTPEQVAGAQSPWPDIWRDNSRTIPAYGAMQPVPVHCDDLNRITAPTLILQGGNTHIDTAMMADKISDCLRNAVALTLGGKNHGFPYSDPQDFAQIIHNFVSLIED